MNRIRVWLLSIALALMAGCGGAGGDLLSGVGSGGTGGGTSTAIGSIRGFGSVIVNGVRYDDAAAVVTDDTGASFARDRLRLGMVVLINGALDTTGLAGRADDIRVISEARGPVRSVSPASSSFDVLGLTVRTTPNTIFDGFANLAAVVPGAAVEVYGFLDATSGVLTATRVEAASAPVATFKARGLVGAVDPTSRSFVFGSLVVDYGSATLAGFSGAPSAGALVAITSRFAPGVNGHWSAERVELVQGPALSSSSVSIEGHISGFVSVARFVLQGVQVDASAARFSHGTAADLANGVRVELTGRMVAGVLVASSVEIEAEEEEGGVEFEVHGTVSALLGGGRFVVRGTTVDGNTAKIEGGTLASLKVGDEVEAHGVMENGVLRAIELHIED